jgi:hypothetical protein
MSTGRAVVNIMGNAVATVVMASVEGELDGNRMRRILNGAAPEDPPAGDAMDERAADTLRGPAADATRGRLQCAPGEPGPGISI